MHETAGRVTVDRYTFCVGDGMIMPAVHGGQPFRDVACRWYALAERRLAHYDELYRSGRWRHYYAGEEQFAASLLEVIRATKIWAELAGRRPADKNVQATKDCDKLRPAA